MRLDILLKEQEKISRTKAIRYIESGYVFVNEKCVQKPAFTVLEKDKIRLELPKINFVSQGGYKLYTALQAFESSVQGKIFADIGASTGGFTDCLLQFGAKKVYAIDVGENQLDTNLQGDDRIVILDNCNARTLTKESFIEQLNGIVIDVSFIALKHILPIASELLDRNGEVYALIKPQFETEGKWLDKHGIVKDIKIRHFVIEKVAEFAKSIGLSLQNIVEAPIVAQKNIEYIAYFTKGSASALNLQNKLNELK